MDWAPIATAVGSLSLGACGFLALLFRENSKLICVLSMQNERQQREITEARNAHTECERMVLQMRKDMADLQRSLTHGS